MIKFESCDPRNKDIAKLVASLDKYLSKLYPAESNHLDSLETLSADNVYFVAAFDNDLPIGCGAVKIFPEYGEMKRLYVLPEYRGRGIGKQITLEREKHLKSLGIPKARLETGIHQIEVISMYKSLEYKVIHNFGTYKADPLSIFLEKEMVS